MQGSVGPGLLYIKSLIIWMDNETGCLLSMIKDNRDNLDEPDRRMDRLRQGIQQYKLLLDGGDGI